MKITNYYHVTTTLKLSGREALLLKRLTHDPREAETEEELKFREVLYEALPSWKELENYLPIDNMEIQE
jgi:hypothetical protein